MALKKVVFADIGGHPFLSTPSVSLPDSQRQRTEGT